MPRNLQHKQPSKQQLTNKIEEVLNLISYLSFLIPVSAGIIFYKSLDSTFRLLFVLTILGAISDSLLQLLPHYKITFIPFANIYVILESVLLPFVFNTLQPFKKNRVWLFVALAIVALTWIVSFKETENFMQFNKYARCTESLLIIVYSYTFLIYESNHSHIPLNRNAAFLLVSVLLCYFCISLALFSISDLILTNHPTQLEQLWHIQTLLNLICNFAFSYCYWCNSRTRD
jgi:hypothetical protein